MENLNAEKVANPNNELYEYVKRIVAAVKYKGESDHEDVPSLLRKFAEGYEQKIKELTEENEKLTSLCTSKDVIITDINAENERLRKSYLDYEETSGLKQVRAAAVKEMAERLKQMMLSNFPNLQGLPPFIDQIAEEMLEEVEK